MRRISNEPSCKTSSVTACGGFRAAKHHADFHPNLVDENHHAIRRLIEPVSLRMAWLIKRACTPTLLESPMSPSSSDFGVKRGNRINNNHAHRARAHQRIDDFKRLLARVRLLKSAIHPDQRPAFSRIADQTRAPHPQRRIRRLFSALPPHNAASAWSCPSFQARKSHTIRPLGRPPIPSDIQPDRPGRSAVRLDLGCAKALSRVVAAHFHDRAFAELPFDLCKKRALSSAFCLSACDEVETLAVIREPVSWLGSWYRYRQRPFLSGRPVSTEGLSFDQFVEAYLAETRPAYANVGAQSKFVEPRPNGTAITRFFKYEELQDCVAYLEERLELAISLPQVNVSPKQDLELSPALEARLRTACAADFHLWNSIPS
jgi:hypothetical protein